MKWLSLLPVLWLLAACQQEPTPQGMDLQAALGGTSAEGFERATGERVFLFPQDHAAHPDYRNEWWYVTGNVDAKDGRRFGYQVTFFRIAVSPTAPVSDSIWATRQLWMAHIALTDVRQKQHYHDQRLSRGAAGLAGQAVKPFRVWLDDWQLIGGDDGQWPWQLSVGNDEFALDLSLAPIKPVVLQGDRGLSQKGEAVGNASWYYSFPRLLARGKVRVAGEELDVSGLSWLDREWSTSALDPNQSGWDWFSLQLDDGHDLMFYRLRRNDGSTDPNSAGKWIPAADEVQTLTHNDVTLTPENYWQSNTGRRYPVSWRMDIPKLNRQWRVEAVLNDQEMETAVIYWEGAVNVFDIDTGEPLGRGYLEMAGYSPA